MFPIFTRGRVKGFLGTILWPAHSRVAAEYWIRDSQGLVLTFHYIGNPILRGVGEELFLSLQEFRRALDVIAEHLRPLPPPEFLKLLHKGKLPARATLITFDDCTHHTLMDALPELKSRGLSACFFVNPGLMETGRTIPSIELMQICAAAAIREYTVRAGSPVHFEIRDAFTRAAAYRKLWPLVLRCPSPLQAALLRKIREEMRVQIDSSPSWRLADWNVLRALDERGMLIGNHTMSHSTARSDGIKRFQCEVAQAYERIEDHVGRKIRVFCYPYGRIEDGGAETENVLRSLNTAFAFVTQGGLADASRCGCLALHREDASYSAGAMKLAPLLACLR
jgi:peptidoglycan/xylan/chitin deacetylase (PgdA/CDA1 family)